MPAWFGLPPIDANVAEGLVLKPEADAALDASSSSAHAARLVNAARLASARSKVGTEANEVVSEIVLDVLVDLEAAFPAAFAGLGAEGEAALRAEIETLASRLVASSRR